MLCLCFNSVTLASVPLPEGMEVQSRPLKNLVSYLKQKDAAGVISLSNKATDQTGVLYAFPPCNFSLDLLRRVAGDLSDEHLDKLYKAACRKLARRQKNPQAPSPQVS